MSGERHALIKMYRHQPENTMFILYISVEEAELLSMAEGGGRVIAYRSRGKFRLILGVSVREQAQAVPHLVHIFYHLHMGQGIGGIDMSVLMSTAHIPSEVGCH